MASGSGGSGSAAKKATSKKADSNSGDSGFLGNTGPQTGADAPPESTPRMPTQQPVHTESGPLNPTDAKGQVEPKHGYADSSTDPTYAAAGGRTIAGEDHVGLVDSDGNDVAAGDLFEDNDSTAGYVTAKDNVEQKFTYANAKDHPVTRQILLKGQRVPRAQAEKLKASLGKKQEPTFG